MRKLGPPALWGWALLAGCHSASYELLVLDSAVRSLGCATIGTTQLDASWAYRVQGCGQIAYYRCAYKRMRVYCRRVETEADAVEIFHPTILHPGGPFPETTVCQ